MDKDMDPDKKRRLRELVPKIRYYKKQERWVCPVQYADSVRSLFQYDNISASEDGWIDQEPEHETRYESDNKQDKTSIDIENGHEYEKNEDSIPVIPIRLIDVVPRRYEFDLDPDIVSFFNSRIQI
jgi:hypothetical protein